MVLPRKGKSTNHLRHPGNRKLKSGDQRRKDGSLRPQTRDRWRNSWRWASVIDRETRNCSTNTTPTWTRFCLSFLITRTMIGCITGTEPICTANIERDLKELIFYFFHLLWQWFLNQTNNGNKKNMSRIRINFVQVQYIHVYNLVHVQYVHVYNLVHVQMYIIF